MLVVSRVQRAIMGLSTGSGRLPSSAWISTAAVTAEKGASWKLAPMAFASPTVVKVVGATLVGILAVLCLALFLAGNALIRGIQSGAERFGKLDPALQCWTCDQVLRCVDWGSYTKVSISKTLIRLSTEMQPILKRDYPTYWEEYVYRTKAKDTPTRMDPRHVDCAIFFDCVEGLKRKHPYAYQRLFSEIGAENSEDYYQKKYELDYPK